ncbi:hypothetical protein Tco_1380227, partial [Tanacetum coccineum]
TGCAETDHAGANNRVCEVSVLSTTREGACVTILPHNLKNLEESKTSIRPVRQANLKTQGDKILLEHYFATAGDFCSNCAAK